jgi:4-hydroxybenzoate polyprenyltransferase
MNLIRKIVDFFLVTYLFIAGASASMVFVTYILTGQKLELTAISGVAFFSTLLIYNFHKVSTLLVKISLSPKAMLQQFEKISFLTKMMIAISAAGILFSAWFLQPKTLLFFIPIAIITLAYSVPVINIRGTKRRLREILLVKVTTLAFTWSLTTATMPLLDAGFNIFSVSSVMIFSERFLFMFAICIPFEIRDLTQEKTRGNVTLPQLIGVQTSKMMGLLLLFLFVILVYFQFRNSMQHDVLIPLYLSAIVAGLLIFFSSENKSNYYFRIFVDGTMHLQFLLLILFSNFL